MNPNLIIEIGSNFGFYSINISNKIKQLNKNCRIISIDTWLGEDLDMEYLKQKKMISSGYPKIYYQFLQYLLWHV